jgi:hypothetical protein
LRFFDVGAVNTFHNNVAIGPQLVVTTDFGKKYTGANIKVGGFQGQLNFSVNIGEGFGYIAGLR